MVAEPSCVYYGVGLLWNRVTMATSEERLEQLEQALQQAGTALQAANHRIATQETAAGAPAPPVTTTSSGKPSNFA